MKQTASKQNRTHDDVPRRRNGCIALALLLPIVLVISSVRVRQARADADDAPIFYSKTTPRDPVSELQKRIDTGEIQFNYDARFGYLKSVLESLKISPASQGLVFSKTSFQRKLISPRNPRALYFNDDTYIGIVPGGSVIEVASMDPKLGTNFYILKQEQSQKPHFIRQTNECLQCHESGSTNNVPGLLMRSVYPDVEGEAILTAGTFVSNEQSPLAQRWGGWYVTGKCGRQTHMGNVTCSDEDHADETNFVPTSGLASLDKFFNTSAYLQPGSDAVALMVVAHQTHLHNLMTAANYEVQMAIRESDAMNQALHQPGSMRSESTTHRIHGVCDSVVRGLLFCDEAKLTDPITGTTKFAEEFAARGPKDSQGRSLRDLDMTHRMFKYPCSYLIYSEQFDALPEEARTYIYRRLWQVLTGREDDPAFDHLSDEDRSAVIEILRETKKGLPVYWKGKHESPRIGTNRHESARIFTNELRAMEDRTMRDTRVSL